MPSSTACCGEAESFPTGERLDADEVVVGAIVDRFGGLEMAGERARDWHHIREVPMLGVELAMFDSVPTSSRARFGRTDSSTCWPSVLSKYCACIHRVDRVLDGARLGVETIAGLVPDTDREHRVKRNGLPLHQRMNLSSASSPSPSAGKSSFHWHNRPPPDRAPSPPC
jgi:hypothetical protein